MRDFFIYDICLILWFLRLGSLSSLCFLSSFLWIAFMCICNNVGLVNICSQMLYFGMTFIYVREYFAFPCKCRNTLVTFIEFIFILLFFNMEVLIMCLQIIRDFEHFLAYITFLGFLFYLQYHLH